MEEQKKLKTIEISSLEELRKLANEIPDGTIYSLQMEVIMTNEQDHGEPE